MTVIEYKTKLGECYQFGPLNSELYTCPLCGHSTISSIDTTNMTEDEIMKSHILESCLYIFVAGREYHKECLKNLKETLESL